MPLPLKPARLALGLSALALTLGGCVSFGPEIPDTLMSLSPAQAVPAGAARTVSNRNAIAVMTPNVVQMVATPRVPVQSGPNAVAYLKDAQWLDAPARLFRDLLAETIEARTGRAVPDIRMPALAPDTRLSGRLEQFGVDAPTMSAVVTYDAVLSRTGRDDVQTRRFEARVPVSAVDAKAVPPALNQAANQVATEVADWVGR
ncbi:MAG: ABC-type transport auxiliary lipoprotein family protein [Sphingomonas sp.]